MRIIRAIIYVIFALASCFIATTTKITTIAKPRKGALQVAMEVSSRVTARLI